MRRSILLVVLVLSVVVVSQGQAPVSQDASPAPTFSETFSGGTLDKSKWFIDTGKAPGNIANVNSGTLSAQHVDLSAGMLRLSLTQTVSGGITTSVGAEIRSKQLFGYGTYIWVARGASTSSTPKGAGSAVSGSVFDVFNFINDSETEIDFEYQGQSPSTLEISDRVRPPRPWATSSSPPCCATRVPC